MKALVWTAPKQMEIQALPTPEPQADEVLIKDAYVGICSSELGGYLGHNALRVPPLVREHEFSGEIVAIGTSAAETGTLAVGQQVTVNPLSCTGDSKLQRRGLDQLCPTCQFFGAHTPGAYAECVVPARSISPLPARLSLRDGALTEPVGCAVGIGALAGPISHLSNRLLYVDACAEMKTAPSCQS